MARNNKLNAYEKSQKSTMAFSDLERRVFMEAAHRLDKAYKNYDETAKRHPEAKEALRFNWKLWTLIQNDVGSAESPLDDAMKLSMLELSAYVDQQTLRFATEPKKEILAIFRDLNHNICKGKEAKDQPAQTDRPNLEGAKTRAEAPKQNLNPKAPRPTLGSSFTV